MQTAKVRIKRIYPYVQPALVTDRVRCRVVVENGDEQDAEFHYIGKYNGRLAWQRV